MPKLQQIKQKEFINRLLLVFLSGFEESRMENKDRD